MGKYKLINKTTGLETLCDKVTIDGFDYYVSDNPKGGKYIIWLGDTVEHYPKQGTPEITYGTTIYSTNYSGVHAKDWKELIATDKPNNLVDSIKDYNIIDIAEETRLLDFMSHLSSYYGIDEVIDCTKHKNIIEMYIKNC